MSPNDAVFRQHYERYQWAVRQVMRLPGADAALVLDAPCGAGYGTALLGAVAGQGAIGVDIDAETVDYARQRYGSGRVQFVAADLQATRPLTCPLDVVVSFEGIEHVTDQEAMAAGLCGCLAPGGLFIASTPRAGGAGAGSQFHTKELTIQEFAGLFSPYLAPGWRLLGQDVRVGDRFVEEARYMVLVGRRAG